MQAGNIQKPLLCVAAGAHAGRGILYMTGLHKSSGRGYANGYAISMRPETAVVRIQPAVEDLAHPDFTVTGKNGVVPGITFNPSSLKPEYKTGG